MEGTSEEESSADRIISDVLDELVQHYNQSIHAVEETPPYFDSLLGYPPQIPPVVRFHLDRLTSQPSDRIVEWIHGYVAAIRPLLFGSAVGCVPVLQHYELVLSQWLSHIRGSSPLIPSKNIREQGLVVNTIETLASDITVLSSPSLISISKYVRCNIVLPSLMRILDQSFQTVSLLWNDSGTFPNYQSSGIRCAVSLLAFRGIRFDPPTIAPSLVRTDKAILDKLCSCPPMTVEEKHGISQFLSFECVDWSSVRIDGTSWNDPVSGIGSRTADSVWRTFESFFPALASDKPTTQYLKNNFSENQVSDDSSLVLVEGKGKRQRSVLRSFGMVRMAQAVSSHFFGRDMHSWEPESRRSTHVIMGRRVTRKKPSVDEKPYQSVPSRVHVVLEFVSLLGKEEAPFTQDLVPHLLPICLELIDASSAAYVALGASALIHLLDVLDPNSPCWNAYTEGALSVLQTAFTIHHEGSVRIVLGQAQSRLLEISKGAEKRRRQTTRQWVSALHRASIRPASEITCWELLVGGVIPLLYQHAELPNADGMEMGRLGLMALLPLVTGEFVDAKTQVASMVALINLMVAAHPIMPQHGGKIMCQILASIAVWMNDSEKEINWLKHMSLHTAAVALVLCGQSFAGEVLDSISSEREGYQEALLHAIIEIRQRADDLIDRK